jgi:hypothetical protein
MRPFIPSEIRLLATLTFCCPDHATLHVSPTAFRKGYTDATTPVREFLQRTGIHDFGSQQPGERNIRYIDVVGLTTEGSQQQKLSFLRPASKNGRMCRVSMLRGLKRPLSLLADDVLLCTVKDQKLHLCNLTWIAQRDAQSVGEKPEKTAPLSGLSIMAAAKSRVIHVMRCMPECKAIRGKGARTPEISELSGISFSQRPSLLVNAILDELLIEGQVEIVNGKRYRLCH